MRRIMTVIMVLVLMATTSVLAYATDATANNTESVFTRNEVNSFTYVNSHEELSHQYFDYSRMRVRTCDYFVFGEMTTNYYNDGTSERVQTYTESGHDCKNTTGTTVKTDEAVVETETEAVATKNEVNSFTYVNSHEDLSHQYFDYNRMRVRTCDYFIFGEMTTKYYDDGTSERIQTYTESGHDCKNGKYRLQGK